MALFQLTDINFNQKTRIGGAADDLVSSQYNYNTFRYPLDLGNYDKGHYMVIHINQQRETQFKGQTTNDLPTVLNNRAALEASKGSTTFGGNAGTILNVASEVVNKLENTSAGSMIKDIIGGGIKSGINNVLGGGNANSTLAAILKGFSSGASATLQSAISGITSSSFTRTVKRTTDTVALYMPDTLNFTYNQNYSTPNIGGAATGAAAAGASAIDTYNNGVKAGKNGKDISEELGKNLSPFAFAALASQGGDLGKVLFAAGTGLAMNPMMEMIYSSPNFREFQFDFMFYPRDEKEAMEVQNILERLRFHQAPEIKSNTGGFFLVPPSEFDIKFYYNGYENPNIPKISTCVLQSIDIDYAPGGFAAYETPSQPTPALGSTGMPVGIKLSLRFQETEILTKDAFTRKSGTLRSAF